MSILLIEMNFIYDLDIVYNDHVDEFLKDDKFIK